MMIASVLAKGYLHYDIMARVLGGNKAHVYGDI